MKHLFLVTVFSREHPRKELRPLVENRIRLIRWHNSFSQKSFNCGTLSLLPTPSSRSKLFIRLLKISIFIYMAWRFLVMISHMLEWESHITSTYTTREGSKSKVHSFDMLLQIWPHENLCAFVTSMRTWISSHTHLPNKHAAYLSHYQRIKIPHHEIREHASSCYLEMKTCAHNYPHGIRIVCLDVEWGGGSSGLSFYSSNCNHLSDM